MNFDTQQAFVLESLKNPFRANFMPPLAIASKAIVCNSQLMSKILGEFGTRLRRFVEDVDINHPGIYSILDGQFVDWSGKLCELLRLAEYAEINEMNSCLGDICRAAIASLPPALKSLDSPFKNNQHIRLISSRDKRDDLRTLKQMRMIDLRLIFKKGRSIWDGSPCDFSMYLRNSDLYKKEIEKAEKKVDRFKSLGCAEMAGKIQETIDSFTSEFSESYYGFHKITMTKSAIILAKMHGFNLDVDSDGECESISKGRILYSPRAYPYKQVVCPSIVSDILQSVECFDGKALFDHYIVVIPTISGEELDVTKKIEVKSPILLGEVDGKCYFICYWLGD